MSDNKGGVEVPRKKHETEEDACDDDDWRQKCVDKFGLLPLPDEWLHDKLRELSTSNNHTWKRYFTYRDSVTKSKNICTGAGPKKLKTRMEIDADTIGYPLWSKHAFPFSSHGMRISEYDAVIFSPYAIPQAIELEHRYQYRTRMYSIEFFCNWGFKLRRFDGDKSTATQTETTSAKQKHGDVIQQRLAKLYPEGGFFYEDPPYDTNTGFEYLCSNGVQDPPDNEGTDIWHFVEKINVSNFTPSTVSRMRRWLFGSFKSTEILSDYDFLLLLFASCGCSNFEQSNGESFGYTWSPSGEVDDEMEAMGLDTINGLSWLEYQARLVSGSLRPQDTYYEPYDEVGAKGFWGESVLQEKADAYFADEEEEEEMKELWKVPWMVWERGENRYGLLNHSEHGVNETNCILS